MRPGVRSGLGWGCVALGLAYVAWCHHGLGSSPDVPQLRWYEPRGFLRSSEWVAAWRARAPLDFVLLLLPSLVLAAAVFAGTRSAAARALALCSAACTSLLCFYGLYALPIWRFFGWRGSLTILALGAIVGCALAAPLLAARWLRMRPLAQALTYAPVFVGIVASLRNATGWDPSLPFNLGPWPAIPVFGFEIAAYTIAGVQFGLALALVGVAHAGRQVLPALLAVLAGCALAVLWFWARFPLPGDSPAQLVGGFALGFVALAAAFALPPAADRGAALRRRALTCALGAGLVAAPLFSGRSLAEADYVVTRFVRAQTLIDALQAHYEVEQVYPDALDELVEAGRLRTIPQPRVGFAFPYALGWIEPYAFEYSSLGSSFVLEFVSTEWVQCAYNPPWIDEEDGDGEDGLDEVWSCPGSRPELW